MKTKPTVALFILFISVLAVRAPRASAATDVFSQLVTEGGRADLRTLAQVNRADISQIMRDSLADKAAEIRQVRDTWKKDGLDVGAGYEMKLAEGVTATIAAEDMPSFLAWDQKSPPPFPFDFKVQAKKEGATTTEGSVEVRYNPSKKETFGIEHIQIEGKKTVGTLQDHFTAKISGTADKPVVEIDVGKGLVTPQTLKDLTGVDAGIEQHVGMDTSRSADDFYTDDMQRSDWCIARAAEDLVSKIKWGVSGSVNYEKELPSGDKLVAKGKYTVGTDKIRGWWTNWLFSDADAAADRLNEQLDQMAKWRRRKIEEEARRRGVDPTGKDTATLIKEVRQARQEQGVTTPVFRRQPGTTPPPSGLPVLPAPGSGAGDQNSGSGSGLKPFR